MGLIEYTISPNWFFTIQDMYNWGNEDPEKQLHYPIVRDHVATGIQATASLIKYWENATKNHHNFSAAYMKSVIPHIPHTEIYQMRKFNSIIRHLNQARMEATVTYCKNVLMQFQMLFISILMVLPDKLISLELSSISLSVITS